MCDFYQGRRALLVWAACRRTCHGRVERGNEVGALRVTGWRGVPGEEAGAWWYPRAIRYQRERIQQASHGEEVRCQTTASK